MNSKELNDSTEFNELVKELKLVVAILQKNARTYDCKFISNEEFVSAMGICKRTAQNWRDEGLITFSQIGSKIYYHIDDIAHLMQINRNEKFAKNFKLNRINGK